MTESTPAGLPVDPDVDRPDPAGRTPSAAHPGPILTVVAVGGAIGSVARFAVGQVWPIRSTGFPAATFTVNVVGCLLIGVLVAIVTERGHGHALWRPFLGTGVFGGFTTFSTYQLDTHRLLAAGEIALAAAYLVGTVVAALGACRLGLVLARRWTAP